MLFQRRALGISQTFGKRDLVGLRHDFHAAHRDPPAGLDRPHDRDGEFWV